MKTNLELIEKCDQIWDEMLPCKSGKFCQQCSKVVIDFRDLSDQEVAETHMFSKERICGIYREDQLEIKKPITKTKRYSKVRMNAIWLGLLGLIYTNDIKANILEKTQTIQFDTNTQLNNSNLKPFPIQDSIPIKNRIIIHGLLKYEKDEIIIGGTVLIKDTKVGTISDINGYYQLDITEAMDSLEQITLVYQYTGSKTYEHHFKKGDELEINIKLDESEPSEPLNVIGYGVLKSERIKEEPTKKSFFDKIKNVVTKKSKKENNKSKK